MKKNLIYTALGLMGLMVTLAIGEVNAQEINKDIVIEATATEANQTITINKYFANAYTVDRKDGTPVTGLTSNTTHTYSNPGTYTITLSLSGADRWTFKSTTTPLVPISGTSMTGVKIIYMPSLADGFGEYTTAPGDNFFRGFNSNGKITSLPEGSFDTSKVTTVGNYFFYYFNRNGALISLPENSFDTSNITTVGVSFFYSFNQNGKITSLPEGSFRFSSGLISVGDGFFIGFNNGGLLTSLPTGSFDTSHITTVGYAFFSSFNADGALTRLPTESFDITNVRTVENRFFYGFNSYGQLTSLPEGSFILSTGLTVAGNDFFRQFNAGGQLTSLPNGSFDISNLRELGDNAFRYFNGMGNITSLPEGSFDHSNIKEVGEGFFSYFNYNGKITNLPSSFIMNGTGASKTSGYSSAFNSTGYTLNKRVSDLVSGFTVLLDDRDTFSDNQPGRCGVHENWLVNPATACKTVTFETNSGTLVDSQTVDIDANEKIIKLTDPTKTGYTFSGWYSDENLTELFDFSTVIADDTTLYAKWDINQYTITLDIDGTLITITGDYGSQVNKPANPSKEGYKFVGWEPEIPDTMPAENIIVKVKWEKVNGGPSGGGGRSKISNDEKDSTNNPSVIDVTAPLSSGAQGDSDDSSPLSRGNTASAERGSTQTYTQEFQEAYEFAKEKGITTMPTINDANMNGMLTRIAMAKMLSYYAINVLGMKPDETRNNKFNDITEELDAHYDRGVTLAYQLGIMGQNMPNNKFRPNDEVTRAEFATALSRMLYSTPDGKPYYATHLEKLKAEKILTNDDYKMKELRGYVMIMLMRSAK